MKFFIQTHNNELLATTTRFNRKKTSLNSAPESKAHFSSSHVYLSLFLKENNLLQNISKMCHSRNATL